MLQSIPKHTQKIGNNYVLWFEETNSYIVLSNSAYLLLSDYLAAKNEDDFVQNIQKNHLFSKEDSIAYSRELASFLQEVTSIQQPSITTSFVGKVPAPSITKHYNFGDVSFTIHFSSEKVLNLIHPQLQHASVDQQLNSAIVFDVFEQDDELHLFKNAILKGSYAIRDFHLLQGKFAMELVTSLYNNTEADWLGTFHASSICNDTEAIMIIGDSGNGKSTLSAILMAHGWDLLADDITPMLAENQNLYRYPAGISIKEGAFPVIQSLHKDFDSLVNQISSSKKIKVKYVPPILPFGSSQKHFECHKIVMVNYEVNCDSELRECPSEKLLQTFVPDSWISPNPEHSKQFLNWLKDVKFYELNYSSNAVAIAKFEELFEL